jgi:acetolactate synthase-1/2/3 large subunit
MGFSFPASVGAAFGLREQGRSETVISINGDGGFLMNCQELGVAAAHKLPIKVVILNNSFLGMVRQWQELFHEERYSHTDLTDTNPDFVKLAEAYHCAGLRATKPDEVDAVIEQAWAINDRPVVMEFRVITEEMVFPMVPAGAATDNMITQRFRPDDCA